MGSAPLPLQRGWDTLKISSRQLIREKQAVAVEMFVVVRLLWLPQAAPQCTGGEGPGHVWALWSIALRSLWNRAWLKHQRVFHALIWWSRADICKSGICRLMEQDVGLTGVNWITEWKPPGEPMESRLTCRSNTVVEIFCADPAIELTN